LTDLFDENNKTPTTVTTEVKVDETILDLFADKLMAIKKEDGTPKYDTLEKALDALAASQQHIPRLEAENKVLAEKAARAAELEEIVKRMSNGNAELEKPKVETLPNGGLSEQSAADLVRKILNEDRAVDQAKSNVINVQNKLVEQYGGEAGAVEALKLKAKELGTTLPQLKELSAQNPNLVLALFGKAQSSPSATTSSINGGAIRPAPSELKRPEKSLISGIGATDRARADFMRQVREQVDKRLGVVR
jgi:hypothetical protein